jgi:hypothetical protein
MSYASLNGARVTHGRIFIPSYGIWVADVSLASSTTIPTTAGALTLVAADLSLVGTVHRHASYGGVLSVCIVGGYGGWSKRLAKKSYQFAGGVPIAMVLGDAAADVGEQVAFTSTPSKLASAFARPALVASYLLGQLAGPIWWVRPDGVTLVGPHSTTPIASTFQLISFSGAQGRVTVAADSLADFSPARTFSTPALSTRTISTVMHDLKDSGEVRTIVSVTP